MGKLPTKPFGGRMMECPDCGNELQDLPSQEGSNFKGCKHCSCVLIYTPYDQFVRCLHDHEALQRVDGVYYLTR